jgi:hypothetical protein
MEREGEETKKEHSTNVVSRRRWVKSISTTDVKVRC